MRISIFPDNAELFPYLLKRKQWCKLCALQKSTQKVSKTSFTSTKLTDTSRITVAHKFFILIINSLACSRCPKATSARQYLLSITGRQLQNRTFSISLKNIFVKQSLVYLPKLIIQCSNEDTMLTV